MTVKFPGPYTSLTTDEQRDQWTAWAKQERARAGRGLVRRYLALSPAARVVARKGREGGGEFFGGMADWIEFAEEVEAKRTEK